MFVAFGIPISGASPVLVPAKSDSTRAVCSSLIQIRPVESFASLNEAKTRAAAFSMAERPLASGIPHVVTTASSAYSAARLFES